MLPPNLPPKNVGSKGVVLNGLGTVYAMIIDIARDKVLIWYNLVQDRIVVWWRWRESNPRLTKFPFGHLQV